MSGVLKPLGVLLGTLLAVPARVQFSLMTPLIGWEKALLGPSERIASRRGIAGIYTRAAFYRSILHHVGKDPVINFMTMFTKPESNIGDHVYCGRHCSFGLVDIGDYVRIADHVQVVSGRHQHQSEVVSPKDRYSESVQFKRIHIGSGAWIGTAAVIMADVGDCAVVGAGAVVVKPVRPNTTVVGVPAEVVR